MKKILFTCLLAFSFSMSHAQDQFAINLNTYTTNYWLASAGYILCRSFDSEDDELSFRPSCDFIFPISINNNAPEGFGSMRGGYTRAFSAPWKWVGDYSIGLGGSWDNVSTPFGAYVGLNYKSNEVVFKDDDRNDRAHYFSPELGMRLRFGDGGGFLVEVGASYDMVLSYKGKYHDYSKDAINGGFCANMAIGIWGGSSSFVVKYSHPTYNFYNQNFTPDNGMTFPFKDVNRKLGYISLLFRFGLGN